MYQTFSFSLSLTHYELWHLSREWMHKSKSPNSNFWYFFFFLFWLCVSFFGKIKILLPLLWHSPMGSSPLDPPPSSPFFFDSPPSVFFFLFPIRPDTYGKWVRRRRRVHRSIWERIELNGFILTNPIRQQYPVEFASSPLLRKTLPTESNQMKKKKKGKRGKIKFKSTEKMLSNFIPQ